MASILKGQSGQPIQFETKPNVNGDDVLTRPEIVGTVSQSGGVPTGAIIQRGSNANGEFIRYADGTQICRRRFGSIQTSAFTLANKFNSYGNISFPLPFISGGEPDVSLNLITNAAAVVGRSYAFTNSSITTDFINNVGVEFLSTVSGYISELSYVAIGRWY